MIKRQAKKIHIGDNRYVDGREVGLEMMSGSSSSDDEMATRARLVFEINEAELEQLTEVGLLEPDSCPKSSSGKWRLQFRTDGDLLDEEDEALTEEWEDTQADPSSPLGVWCDLEYWELQLASAV